ncbi:MAG: hypothetical protein AAFN81_06705 [Bacteroidota bacterium]
MRYFQFKIFLFFLLTLALNSCIGNSGLEFETSDVNESDFQEKFSEIAASINQKDGYSIGSLKYRFIGKGTIWLSKETEVENDVRKPYVLMRYFGSKEEQDNVEMYFKIGIDNYDLPSNLDVELAFLENHVVIKGIESKDIHYFTIGDVDTSVIDVSSVTEVDYIIISSSNPRDINNSRNGAACYCSCGPWLPGTPQRELCVCQAPACDENCVALCSLRRRRQAVCYNNCIIE